MLVLFVILLINTSPSTKQDELVCNGDRNASIRECGNPCKSTCKEPNVKSCRPRCETNYCQCLGPYLLSDDGKCILPNDCPGGNPCRQNETFVYCNANCPENYCPVDDSIYMMTCDAPYPCNSGCGCQRNYKRKSRDDDSCVLASDCPPVNCTRQYEEWDPCSVSSDNCRYLQTEVSTSGQSDTICEPKCVCKEGYCRNDSDVCVPVPDCWSRCISILLYKYVGSS